MPLPDTLQRVTSPLWFRRAGGMVGAGAGRCASAPSARTRSGHLALGEACSAGNEGASLRRGDAGVSANLLHCSCRSGARKGVPQRRRARVRVADGSYEGIEGIAEMVWVLCHVRAVYLSLSCGDT